MCRSSSPPLTAKDSRRWTSPPCSRKWCRNNSGRSRTCRRGCSVSNEKSSKRFLCDVAQTGVSVPLHRVREIEWRLVRERIGIAGSGQVLLHLLAGHVGGRLDALELEA